MPRYRRTDEPNTRFEEQENWLLDSYELAQMLRCDLRSIYNFRQKNGLPWIKLGSKVLFRRNEVDRWLESLQTVTEPQKKKK